MGKGSILTFVLLVSTAFLVALGGCFAADFNHTCSAEVVYEYKLKGLSQKDWELILDTARQAGTIDLQYFHELMEVVNRIYFASDTEITDFIEDYCKKEKRV